MTGNQWLNFEPTRIYVSLSFSCWNSNSIYLQHYPMDTLILLEILCKCKIYTKDIILWFLYTSEKNSYRLKVFHFQWCMTVKSSIMWYGSNMSLGKVYYILQYCSYEKYTAMQLYKGFVVYIIKVYMIYVRFLTFYVFLYRSWWFTLTES